MLRFMCMTSHSVSAPVSDGSALIIGRCFSFNLFFFPYVCDLKRFPVLIWEVTAFSGHIMFQNNCCCFWGGSVIWKGLWRAVSAVLRCSLFRKIWTFLAWRSLSGWKWLLGDERVTGACNPCVLCLLSPKGILNWCSLRANRTEKKYHLVTEAAGQDVHVARLAGRSSRLSLERAISSSNVKSLNKTDHRGKVACWTPRC